MPERPLNPKQKTFVAEYLIDLNATQAARRAGYRPRRAQKTGSRLLQRRDVRAAIAEAQAQRLAKLDMDAEAVLTELAKIARASVLDYMRVGEDGEPIIDLSRLNQDNAAAIANVTIDRFKGADGADKSQIRRVKISFHNKVAALHELARHFGLAREYVGRASPDGPDPEPQHDTRQVARAVIAILDSARLAEEEEGGLLQTD
jgi:phage terminase small subunit